MSWSQCWPCPRSRNIRPSPWSFSLLPCDLLLTQMSLFPVYICSDYRALEFIIVRIWAVAAKWLWVYCEANTFNSPVCNCSGNTLVPLFLQERQTDGSKSGFCHEFSSKRISDNRTEPCPTIQVLIHYYAVMFEISKARLGGLSADDGFHGDEINSSLTGYFPLTSSCNWYSSVQYTCEKSFAACESDQQFDVHCKASPHFPLDQIRPQFGSSSDRRATKNSNRMVQGHSKVSEQKKDSDTYRTLLILCRWKYFISAQVLVKQGKHLMQISLLVIWKSTFSMLWKQSIEDNAHLLTEL